MPYLINPFPSENWQKRELIEKTSITEVLNGGSRTLPIPEFIVNYSFNSPVLAISCTIVNNSRNWKKAAYIKQAIDTGISNGKTDDAFLNPKTLYLDQINIVNFSSLISPYQILITPVKWLSNLKVEIWEYVGSLETSNNTNESSLYNLLINKIDNLNLKIDTLLNINNNQDLAIAEIQEQLNNIANNLSLGNNNETSQQQQQYTKLKFTNFL